MFQKKWSHFLGPMGPLAPPKKVLGRTLHQVKMIIHDNHAPSNLIYQFQMYVDYFFSLHQVRLKTDTKSIKLRLTAVFYFLLISNPDLATLT